MRQRRREEVGALYTCVTGKKREGVKGFKEGGYFVYLCEKEYKKGEGRGERWKGMALCIY